jgi:hypothetical protein
MNRKKLINQIKKYYYSHGQELIIDTREMFTHNDDDCCFDVYLADSDIFLFTIQNYNAFRDLEVVIINYFKEPKCKIIETWDGVKASYIPLYFDQTFTLKTFKQITKKEMIQATDYFVREILHMLIFNIRFTKEEKK